MDRLPVVEGSGGRPDITKEVRLEGQALALKLRRQGLTYQAIADMIGVTKATAWKWVVPVLMQQVTTNADALRHRQQELTNIQLNAIYAQVVAGDLDASARMTAILAAEAKLMGLNAPERVEQVVQQMTEEDKGLRELLAESKVLDAHPTD